MDDGCIAIEKHRSRSDKSNGRPRRTRPVVARINQPTEDGPQSHDVEIGSVHDTRSHLAWFAESDHGKANG